MVLPGRVGTTWRDPTSSAIEISTVGVSSSFGSARRQATSGTIPVVQRKLKGARDLTPAPGELRLVQAFAPWIGRCLESMCHLADEGLAQRLRRRR